MYNVQVVGMPRLVLTDPMAASHRIGVVSASAKLNIGSET